MSTDQCRCCRTPIWRRGSRRSTSCSRPLPPRPRATETLEGDRKGFVSIILYGIALAVSLVVPFVAVAIDLLVSAMWIVPSQRIERRLSETR